MTRPHPLTLAAVVLGLVVAVGSSSYAAGLARGSVGTPQLKNGAVTTAKLRDGAVTGRKVENRSIGRSDLARGVLTPRPTSVRRTLAIGQVGVRLATVGGVRYTADCVDTPGGGGASGRTRIESATGGAPATPLTVAVVMTRLDGPATVAVVTTTGAGGPVQDHVASTYTDAGDRGDMTASGVVQHVGRAPSRVDLAISAIASGPAERGCRFALLVTPAA